MLVRVDHESLMLHLQFSCHLILNADVALIWCDHIPAVAGQQATLKFG